MAEQPRRGVLLALAAEGVIPVVGGCAGALAGGPEAGLAGGVIGVAMGQAVEKVINFFGARIVERWADWFRKQPPEAQQEALAELASLPPEEARQQAESLIDRLALEPLDPADRAVAVDYLSLLPGALDRALPRDSAGVRSLPPTVSLDEAQQLLTLLPVNLPPYPVGSEVPGTPYRLESLLGSGGFGAVYRASTRSLQHLPLAIKFCLDPALTQALNRERANLERLMKAGGENWSPRVVRLYGYDLEHATPYLVYEYVTGGDLIRHLAERRKQLGRGLNPAEVYDLITQTVEALAFAHEHNLVHRDLKPANVLVENGVLKLADFGLGGVTAARSAQVSKIGATTVGLLSLADQASLFRGAGTPLYMAPEQRRGLPPDPRHDLYSLGVMWYQLLVGDVSRELHPGWAKELAVRHGVPKAHINLIESCVGWFDERPKSAIELREQMRGLRDEPAAAPAAPAAPAPPALAPETDKPRAALTQLAQPADAMRGALLVSLVKRLKKNQERIVDLRENHTRPLWISGWVAVALFFVVGSLSGSFLVGFILSVIVALALGCVLVLVQLGKLREARENRHAVIVALKTEFPEIVTAWGGERVLHDRGLVEQIARKLGIKADQDEEEAPLVTVTAMSVALDDQQRRELAGLLEKGLPKCRGAGARPAPFPLWLAILLGLAAGALVGMTAGSSYAGYLDPMYINNWGQVSYFGHRGDKLDKVQYDLTHRKMLASSIFLAISTGLLAALGVAWLLTRREWNRGPLLVGLGLGLLFGGPIGVGLGFLHDALSAPSFQSNYGETQYYDAQGARLSQEDYLLQRRKMNTTSTLVGIVNGLVVTFVVAALFLRRHRRRVERDRQEYEPIRRVLLRDYAELVAAHGGPEALDRPETLQRMQQQVELVRG
jgi:serine/threonine protein kinase